MCSKVKSMEPGIDYDKETQHVFICSRCGNKSIGCYRLRTHKCESCDQHYAWQRERGLPGDRNTECVWKKRRVYD